MGNHTPSIAFIGFGEAGQAFATGLRGEGQTDLCAHDIKPGALPDVETCASHADAVAKARLIFSLVTADQAETAAAQVAQSDLSGRIYLDCNSCAPDTKRRAAKLIEAAGGAYVDVAVMTPVHPKLHKAPCLLAGPHAEAAQSTLTDLGMTTTVAGPKVGDASTIKMIRSIMVKGLEALTLECFLAARTAGIEDTILQSLTTSYPGFDWPARAPYMIERAMTHGIRRAAEMREVVQTLRDLGLDPAMTTGTVTRQQQIGALKLNADHIGADNLTALTDAILHAMPEQPQT